LRMAFKIILFGCCFLVMTGFFLFDQFVDRPVAAAASVALSVSQRADCVRLRASWGDGELWRAVFRVHVVVVVAMVCACVCTCVAAVPESHSLERPRPFVVCTPCRPMGALPFFCVSLCVFVSCRVVCVSLSYSFQWIPSSLHAVCTMHHTACRTRLIARVTATCSSCPCVRHGHVRVGANDATDLLWCCVF
jgi:hypothetical protein